MRGGGVGSDEQCEKRVDSVLDLFSDLYSELDTISIGISQPSSCPILYYLLTSTLLTTALRKE